MRLCNSICISETFQALNDYSPLPLLPILNVEIGCRRANREKRHASSCYASVQPWPARKLAWRAQLTLSAPLHSKGGEELTCILVHLGF